MLQIVMVSPGTHLVKNYESLSITNESQLKKTRSCKLKMLGPLCNQTVNLETEAKTLYHSLLKLKYNPSIDLKHKKEENKYASLSNSHRNHMNGLFSQKIFKLIDCSLCLMGRMP